jgi:NitT/TauT family transport system substrate-binding protein
MKQLLGTVIVLIGGLNSAGAALATDGMLKMRFAQSGNTSSSWPLYVAEHKKLFERNGLQLEVIIIRGTSNVVRAVLSETIPIGRINPDYAIGAVEKGSKVRIIAASMEKIPYDIYARPEIKTGGELKGKTLGVSTLTGGTTLTVHEVLEKAYKLKENDYKLLVAGTSQERYNALKHGTVQASFMGPPFNLRAAKEGFRRLANFHEYLGPILFTTDFAHMNFLTSNRQEVVRYLKSMIEATRWLYDPKNRQEAIAIHMKVLKTTRESAEEDYKYLVQNFRPFPRDGMVSQVSFDKTMKLRAKEGNYQGKRIPPASDFVDNTYIEEALKQAGK